MKPSDFQNKSAMNSIFQKTEYEIVAKNVMRILAKNGNNFRKLTWEEYTAERLKDGNFSTREQSFFEDVVSYCASSHGAAAFCPEWAKVAMETGE